MRNGWSSARLVGMLAGILPRAGFRRHVAWPAAALVAVCSSSACGRREVSIPPRSAAVDPADEISGPRVSDPPEFVLTAAELSAEFEADPDGAKAKYFEKVVEITGVITDRDDNLGTPTVSLAGMPISGSGRSFDETPTVLCVFDQPVRQLQDLTLGQDAVVKGVCRGMPFMHWVGIHQSRIIRLGKPVPATVVSAEELTAAYRAEFATTNEKYCNKELTVDGTIAELLREDESDPALVTGFRLAGCFEDEPHPLRVRCLFALVHRPDLVGLRVGQSVRVRGQGNNFSEASLSDDRGVVIVICVLRPRDPAGRPFAPANRN